MKTLIEYLNENIIVEMACDRSKFSNLVLSHLPQIIENWCLVYYCNKYDNGNLNKNHWLSELKTQLLTIIKQKTKHIDRKKVIIDCIINKAELNDSKSIYDLVYYKLNKKEHIDINIVYDICKVVKQNINEIIELFLLTEGKLDDSIKYIGY